MADNVQTAMFDILKKLQAEMSLFRAETNERLGRIEALAQKDHTNSAGMLVMMRSTAGGFDQRIAEVERRMDSLERRYP